MGNESALLGAVAMGPPFSKSIFPFDTTAPARIVAN